MERYSILVDKDKPVMYDGKPTYSTLFSMASLILDGQVLVPVVLGYTAFAPTKKRNFFKLSIDVGFGVEGAPSNNDVSWLSPVNPIKSPPKLRKILVLLAFDEGTINPE